MNNKYTLPFQIWTYYKIGKQTNKIFIFAENALGTNDFELIHSTVQGEKYNANWKNWIYRERGAVNDLDDMDQNRDINLDQNNNLDDKGNRNLVTPGDN